MCIPNIQTDLAVYFKNLYDFVQYLKYWQDTEYWPNKNLTYVMSYFLNVKIVSKVLVIESSNLTEADILRNDQNENKSPRRMSIPHLARI